MRRFVLTIILVFLFIAGAVRADHTRYGPLFVADDAGTEPKGGWEFGGWAPLATIENDDYYLTQYQLSLTYGITDRLELFLAPFVYKRFGGAKHDAEDDGFPDVWVGAKYQIIKMNDFFLTARFSAKDGSRSAFRQSPYLSNGADEYKMMLIASKYLGLLQIDANVGYDIFDDRPDNRNYSNEVNYNLALSHPVVKRVLIVGELDGKTDCNQSSTTTHDSILDAYLGIKWMPIKDRFGLKFAAGKRLTEDNPDLLLALGFASYF
jgi:hypothetical protein